MDSEDGVRLIAEAGSRRALSERCGAVDAMAQGAPAREAMPTKLCGCQASRLAAVRQAALIVLTKLTKLHPNKMLGKMQANDVEPGIIPRIVAQLIPKQVMRNVLQAPLLHLPEAAPRRRTSKV